ncbi:MAG: DNA mismatch endonuclease Vsr [Candidatus Marinimicrobia bacterium]|nr:DNA mismatch endonuclease Vsr [Candidatus Neomarinimicrobiota bacterium]
MVDTFTREKRSEIMTSVKSSGNKSTELKLIKTFKLYGISGWRRKYGLFGNPDFVFPKKRIVLFADGCFWHGHDCRKLIPATNKNYWIEKISRNKKRDKLVTESLIEDGWDVLRLWECKIKQKILSQKVVTKLLF